MRCSKCDEKLSLLTNICPVCGQIVDSADDTLSPKDLALSLESLLRDLRMIPKPTLIKSIEHYSVFTVPVFTILMVVIAVITSGLIFWILSLFCLLWSIIVIVKKYKGKLGNDPYNNQIEVLKANCDYLLRIATMNYGTRKEITLLVNDIVEEVEEVESCRVASKRKNIIVLIVFFLFVILAVGFMINKVKHVVDDNILEYASITELASMPDRLNDVEWESVVSKFNNLTPVSEADRIAIINIALSKEMVTEAEQLFIKNILGESGDFKIAKNIIDHLRSSSQKTAVDSFKAKCNGNLRYSSDNNKLKEY